MPLKNTSTETLLYPQTVTTAGGAVNQADSDIRQYEGTVKVILSTEESSAGSSVSLAVKLQHATAAGGTYADVTGGAFTAVSEDETNDSSVQVLTLQANALRGFLKVLATPTGASGSWAGVSVILAGQKKYL